ncbi:hypothetical protein [Rothia halotolerans]|uniref:hypothetical protein n=1 Tax=Rothia halotolerans TaxID=405770 RepID=UPI00101D499F|nr:hypothetical protein [Rothia halotolerans]
MDGPAHGTGEGGLGPAEAGDPMDLMASARDALAGETVAGRAVRPGRSRGVGTGEFVPDAGEPAREPWEEAAALARALPGSVVNSVTAAQMYGMRLPEWLRAHRTIHLNRGPGHSRVRRAGVISRQCAYDGQDVVRVAGISITSPLRTVLDLADLLEHEELVCVLDGLFEQRGRAGDGRAGEGSAPIRPRPVSRAELFEFRRTHRRIRGIRAFDAAMRRARAGAASPVHTRLRLACEDYGIKGLHAGATIRNAYGEIVFRSDLAEMSAGVSIQVRHPRAGEARQRQRDQRRRRRTEHMGWAEVVVGPEELERTHRIGTADVPHAVILIRRAITQQRLRP